jgi:hypothetical protein
MYSAGIELIGSLFVCATTKTTATPYKLIVGNPSSDEDYEPVLDLTAGTLAYKGTHSSLLVIPELPESHLLIKDGDLQ